MNDLSRRELNRRANAQKLLEAALSVFARMGYSGASMDAVAEAAGLSKPTLYKYFDSKEVLFTAMMQARRDDMLMAFEVTQAGSMVEQLHAFAWRYARTVLQPDLMSLARLIIAEVPRFPEVGRAYQASGPDRLLAGMMRYLEERRAAGELVFEQAELAAEDLWGLILSAPRSRALYEPEWRPDDVALGRYINNGLRVFLRAYAVAPEDQLAALEAVIAKG
jgi:AcrR family transcriptional regulator